MVPDLNLQLQVSIKALQDNVRPAVSPDNKIATEQLHLVIATLELVRKHLSFQRRLVRRLLEDGVTLAEELAQRPGATALEGAIAEAKAALQDAELEADQIEAARAKLTTILVAAVADASEAEADALARIVVRASQLPLERLRAWCLPSGFEPEADLRPLDALV